MLNFLKKLFTYTERNWDEEYLSRASDHVDLERRIRELDRRQIVTGPFGYKRIN